MNVVIGSAFRRSSLPHVRRWASQISVLRSLLREHYFCAIRCIAVEGDSNDNGTTRDYITAECTHHHLDLDLRTCNHGGPWYGSIEHPDRMAALSQVGNCILDGVRANDDILVYVESDLIWDSGTIHKLIDLVITNKDYQVVSPMIFAGQMFYDVWACRGLDGQRFSPLPPYHSSLNNGHGLRFDASLPLYEVSSTGSCLVMRGEVARTIRITNDDALVGWCHNARQSGHRIAICPDLTVRHPA